MLLDYFCWGAISCFALQCLLFSSGKMILCLHCLLSLSDNVLRWGTKFWETNSYITIPFDCSAHLKDGRSELAVTYSLTTGFCNLNVGVLANFFNGHLVGANCTNIIRCRFATSYWLTLSCRNNATTARLLLALGL